MQRYFTNNQENNNFILTPQDLHHIKKVMRNKPGDQIEVVYKNMIYLCQINNLEPLTLTTINTYHEDRSLPINLTVAISLVTEQKFDLILQKLTELGVSTIIPLKTERSIVKLDSGKIAKKMARWQIICKEASEQSHRTDIPEIKEPITIKELANYNSKTKLLCSLQSDPKPLNEYLENNLDDILFAIGPEGGFSKTEEDILLNNQFKSVTLGKRVLRVETAAIYVASIINYVYKG